MAYFSGIQVEKFAVESRMWVSAVFNCSDAYTELSDRFFSTDCGKRPGEFLKTLKIVQPIEVIV